MQRENLVEPLQLRSPDDFDDYRGDNGRAPRRRPKLVWLSDVTPKPVRWLWPGRFPLAKLALVSGDPDLGKSMMLIDMAARVSTGTPWPDRRDQPIEPGGVIMLSAEDDVDDVIRPRLDAAGADASRIIAIQGVEFDDAGMQHVGSFNLEGDLPALEDAIQRCGERAKCRLVIIDPVSAFMGKTDSHRNAEVRGVLAPLGELATRHGLAVVVLTHLTKSYGGKAMYRSTGSLAFTAAARAAWLVVADKDDPSRRLMLPVKSNLARKSDGLAYRIESKAIDGVEDVPYLLWDAEPVTMTADEAVAAENDPDRTEREDAKEWLERLLVVGPMPVKDIKGAAEAEGHSWRTLVRAKASLNVQSVATGAGGRGQAWSWKLPESATVQIF